jgi:hypothetical protein
MELILPPTAVVRVSTGTFDPAGFADVKRMSNETGEYLTPAIRRLPGLIKYFAALSPTGSIVHVSVWESEAHAQQMSRLKEMIEDARRDAKAVGVTFSPIVNHAVNWSI